MNKITDQARRRRERESLQSQLLRNRETIAEMLERNRKIDFALRLIEECDAHGINTDMADVNFQLIGDSNGQG